MLIILAIVLVAIIMLRAFMRDKTARTWMLIVAAALAAMICWILLLPLGI